MGRGSSQREAPGGNVSGRFSTSNEAGVLGVNERGGELGEVRTQRILYIFYQNA